MHKARRFCSCLKSARWGHQFIYLAGTIFLPEFYILIYKICTCYAMEYENIFNNCVQPIRFFGHCWTLFFCPCHIQTSPLPSTHTYMLWNIKYFNNDCYSCILIEFGMDSSNYFKPLDLHKIRRCIFFSFFQLTWEFLDPFGERGGFF